MARQVTIKAFEAWIADEANVEAVLDHVAGGKTLQKTALAVKQPYTCLHGYFHRTPEAQARYEAARKAWADAVMDEAMRIADGAKPTPGDVQKAKLQVETRFNQAKAYHRERWGERVQVDRGLEAPADEKLLGFASELLKLVKRSEPRVIEVSAPGRAEDDFSSSLPSLPAPAAK